MKHFRFAVILLFVLACGLPAPAAQPTLDVNAISTTVAQTLQALTPIVVASIPAQPLATQPLATQAPATQTLPAITQTPMPGCEDSALNTAWNRDRKLYDVKEVNQPLAPNAPFVMSWTFQNTGACTWDSSYLMYFESGTTLTQSPGYPVTPAGTTVAPGQSVTVDIGMTAPAKTGDYESVWRLQNNRGKTLMTFGVLLKVGSGVSAAPTRPGALRYTYDCTSGVLSVSLSWNDKADNEEGYRVYRDGALIADLSAGTTSYKDTAPIISGNYTYVVTAFNAAGGSPAQVTADTPNCH
jgi:hypothetical protein